MGFLDFTNYALWINLAVFSASAGVVWFTGVRITRYADAIARITGVGRAAIGLVLLGGITSLPEFAVAIFSAIAQNPALAVNNLLGGVVMQKAILAACDALIGKNALTVIVSSPTLLLQGALGILLLAIVAAAIAVPDFPLWGAGMWSWLLLGMFAWSIWMLSRAEGRLPWQAQDENAAAPEPSSDEEQASTSDDHGSLKSIIGKTALAGAVILVAGFFLSQTGDAIAGQTGLGQSFVGAVLLAFSTSLPELSTVISAMRLCQYEMAISDILGTNLFNIALIFLVDIVYDGAPVFNEVDMFSLFAALLGIVLTAIYLIGLIERRNRTIARMGIDSFATIAVYFADLLILYQLR